jgi:predicted Zn-dependent protease
MHQHLSQALQAFQRDQAFNASDISEFSPADFRHGIQWLLSENLADLAQALADAGLSLHPHSEDILAMAGLLAMTREDWPLAVELLQDLYTVQGDNAPPMSYQMLARACFCNLDRAEAARVLTTGLQYWPQDAMLLEELSCLGPEFNLAALSNYQH